MVWYFEDVNIQFAIFISGVILASYIWRAQIFQLTFAPLGQYGECTRGGSANESLSSEIQVKVDVRVV